MLLGIDEVGRGPWAGPLVVGAVILGSNNTNLQLWQDLTDSKKLTARRREELSSIILKHAVTGLGWVSAAELDHYGLSASLKLATRRAVKRVLRQKVPFDEIIIDGTVNFLRDTPLANKVSTLKKADLLVKEVSAASIIAKVARDHYMTQLAQTYPVYGFEKHVGYGTAAHRVALLKYGPCPEHRRSFRPITELLAAHPEFTIDHNKSTDTAEAKPARDSEEAPITSTMRGQQAEKIVANYLAAQGHTLIAQNFKTKTYEIDLISTYEQEVYFTEVKYRANSRHGSPLEQITPAKRHQMQYAAETFLTDHPQYNQLQPVLAAGSVSGPDFQLEDWLVI